jgi:hypothetical protein
MGGKLTLHLLDKEVDESWKIKYIDKWIGYAPAFLGSVTDLQFLLSGGNEGLFYVPNYRMREAFITFSSMYWLIPDATHFKNDIMV